VLITSPVDPNVWTDRVLQELIWDSGFGHYHHSRTAPNGRGPQFGPGLLGVQPPKTGPGWHVWARWACRQKNWGIGIAIGRYRSRQSWC